MLEDENWTLAPFFLHTFVPKSIHKVNVLKLVSLKPLNAREKVETQEIVHSKYHSKTGDAFGNSTLYLEVTSMCN